MKDVVDVVASQQRKKRGLHSNHADNEFRKGCAYSHRAFGGCAPRKTAAPFGTIHHGNV